MRRMLAAMKRIPGHGRLRARGACLAALLLICSQTSAQIPNDGRKIKDRRISDEAPDPNAKEMILTGILVPAGKFRVPGKEAKDKPQRRAPKEEEASPPRDGQYILWTDDGRRVILPPTERQKGRPGEYYPYPVINLAHYTQGKVALRVLAAEVSKGLHSVILVKRILDIEQIPSASELHNGAPAHQPEDAEAPQQENK